MIKAVIFDMDGVLIDAREWHFEALNRALALFGFEIPKDEHLAKYDGLPTAKKLEMLSESQGLPRELHRLINKLKQEYTVEIILLRCRPKFIHEYALAGLVSRGLKVAVASNSIAATIDLMMKKAHLLNYLEFYLSNEDVRDPKPSPEIYRKAIDRLNLKPEEVLIVEDNDHGVAAAFASGAHVMRVSGPSEVTFDSIWAEIQTVSGYPNA